MSEAPAGCPRSVAEVNLNDPATQENWYPTYDLLREQAPVWQVPGTNMFVLTRFDDVQYVLRRTDLFLRRPVELPPLPTDSIQQRVLQYYNDHGWQRTMPLAIDPPDHRRYRELVDPFFSVAGAETQRPLITGIVNDLIDVMAKRKRCEFVADFALPLPVLVITIMMGFDVADIPQLKEWSEAWVLPFRGGLSDDEEMYVARKIVEFQHHIKDTIEAKKASPDGSVISFLANEARFRGERPLTDTEIISMVDHLYIGGNETTTFALTSGLWLMLSNPDAHAALLADRLRVKNFVDENLRMESPTQGLPRIAGADTEIAGVKIPKNSVVHLRYAAANRDPQTFACPADLDVDRSNANRHVAFSVGETHCPGAGLSRLEQSIAFSVLLDRLPNLRFSPDLNDFTHHPNFTLRAMKELWIDWD
jgi:cytochrome P450